LSLELDEVQKGKEEFAEKYLEAHEDNKVLRAKIMLDILQLDVRVVADDPSLLEEKQQADAQVERQKAQIEEMQEEGLNKDLQINELESQREQQANDIETLQLQLDESRIQCQQQEQQLDDLFKTQEIDTQAISDLQDQLSKKEHELEDRLQMLTKLISKNEQLQNQNRTHKTRLEKFKKEGLANFQREIQEKNSEVEVLKEMVKGVQLQLRGKDKDIANFKAKIKLLQVQNQLTQPTPQAGSTAYSKTSYRGNSRVKKSIRDS